jgi:hypothetical protein
MAGHGAAKIKSAGAFRFVCLEFDVMREVSADITLLERLGPALRGLLFWVWPDLIWNLSRGAWLSVYAARPGHRPGLPDQRPRYRLG